MFASPFDLSASFGAQATTAGNLFEGDYTGTNKSAWNQTVSVLSGSSVPGQLYYNDGIGGNPLSDAPASSQYIGTTASQQRWIKYTNQTLSSCTGLAPLVNPDDWSATYAIATGADSTLEYPAEMRWEMQKELYKAALLQPDSLLANPVNCSLW